MIYAPFVVILTTVNDLQTILANAIERAPVSERTLAAAAGVSYTTLQRIRTGDLAATRRVAGMVADALEVMGSFCDSCASEIRRALDEGKES